MQNTLMRLMKKKGLRRDPFERLVTTAITPTDDNFTDAPSVSSTASSSSTKSNPLFTRKLKLRNKGNFEGSEPPSAKQDPFLNPLKSDQDDRISGENPPSEKQNPLLKNLKGHNSGRLEGQTAPSLRQSNLLRQLRPGNTGNADGLEAPNKHPVS